MENANPPLTLNLPILPTALRTKVVQELDELQAICAYIDSCLENIEQFLNCSVNLPNEIYMDYLESEDESIDTPFVSPFLDSDNREVLNKLEEYGNAGRLCRKKVINIIDGDDLAYPCMIGFRKYVTYFDPFLPMNIITRKAYNNIMVEGLESTEKTWLLLIRMFTCLLEASPMSQILWY
nr:hypothetical protein [Tanacetum cinerariifolium]